MVPMFVAWPITVVSRPFWLVQPRKFPIRNTGPLRGPAVPPPAVAHVSGFGPWDGQACKRHVKGMSVGSVPF